MAIGFYAAYAGPPLSLYGSALLIILAFAARFLPIAYASSQAAIRAVHPEMEEAARILGSGRLHAIRKDHGAAHQDARCWAAGWWCSSSPRASCLPPIFLVGPRTRTMSVLLYDLTEQGNFEVVSAFGGILLAITMVIVVIGMKLVGRDFMLRRE
jgi:iron(III) transport system permease protein